MKFYLVCEVAEILRLSESQVYALINSGRLRCHRLTTGKQGGIRVSEQQLAEFLKTTETQDADVPDERAMKHVR
jgi:excisionase family DNA binding protein